MQVVKGVAVLLVVLTAGLMLAACGSGGSSGSSSGGGSSSGAREVKATATDFKFEPAEYKLKPGEKIKVTMANKGALDHTWVMTDAGGKEIVRLEVGVGKTGSKEFTVPAAGNYVLVCDVAGHKEVGMVGKVTVQ